MKITVRRDAEQVAALESYGFDAYMIFGIWKAEDFTRFNLRVMGAHAYKIGREIGKDADSSIGAGLIVMHAVNDGIAAAIQANEAIDPCNCANCRAERRAGRAAAAAYMH